ncbi:asparagine-linked glycosylation protein, partial [Cichlidogyrus casuarinus]
MNYIDLLFEMLFSLLVMLIFTVLACCFSTFIILMISFRIIVQLRRNTVPRNGKQIVSFFHPNCLSGGGGERVLWIGVNALLKKYKNIHIVIHSAELVCFESPSEALQRVSSRFGIGLCRPEAVSFSPILRTAFLLKPECYPILTLLGQFIGGTICSLEALIRFPSDVIVDTVGCAGLIIPWKLFGQAQVVCYVHYPTISTSMLGRVVDPTSTGSIYNNSDWIRESHFFTALKVYYYKLFASLYGFCGTFSDVVMTNSTWTQNHVKALWGGNPTVVYPPCDTAQFSQLYELEDKPGLWIISSSEDVEACRLLLVGSCRDESDEVRVKELKVFADQLGISHAVDFHLNTDFAALRELVSRCTVNLHTMLEEHFGISVVEGMAAGLLTVAHNSGGPQTDIIGPDRSSTEEGADWSKGVGYLCSTETEYADTFHHIFNKLTREQLNSIRSAAKSR